MILVEVYFLMSQYCKLRAPNSKIRMEPLKKFHNILVSGSVSACALNLQMKCILSARVLTLLVLQDVVVTLVHLQARVAAILPSNNNNNNNNICWRIATVKPRVILSYPYTLWTKQLKLNCQPAARYRENNTM